MGGVDCVVVAAGMGKNAAARGCAIAKSVLGSLDALLSLGWAGALTPGVRPARCYAVAEAVDADTGERFPTSPPLPSALVVNLVTLGHVARAPEKRQLAERFDAVLVDMEAATVARIAQATSLDFFCFKAVSDTYDEVLPDFSRYSDARGRIRMRALLAHTAFRPRYWPAMVRMNKNTKSGAIALAAAVQEFLEIYADNG
jgi:adenosylhomocysteine nucleosidase